MLRDQVRHRAYVLTEPHSGYLVTQTGYLQSRFVTRLVIDISHELEARFEGLAKLLKPCQELFGCEFSRNHWIERCDMGARSNVIPVSSARLVMPFKIVHFEEEIPFTTLSTPAANGTAAPFLCIPAAHDALGFDS